MYITTDRTVQNRPDIDTLEKKMKEAYAIDVAIPNSHNLHSTITEKLKKYRLERRAYKNTATEHRLYGKQ
jgi:hypothetical protein